MEESGNSQTTPAGSPPSNQTTAPILECDGQELKRMIQTSMNWFERHTAAVNALNVFPVPDGDTGTNMFLTLQAAWEEISPLTTAEISTMSQAIAHGALMGARGNSGVILSQLFRGMAQALEGANTMDAAGLVNAMKQASQTAYKAVIRPVEGTILTVARRTAEAAEEAAKKTNDIRAIMEEMARVAQRAVEETPTQLDVLAEAGVVDAGGQGFYVILDGMLRHLRGETIVSEAALEESVELVHPEGPEVGYGYDVQFILRGENLDVDAILADIDAMGDSTLVVGDSHTVKVHVHTPEPGNPLNYGAALGSLSRVIVENLQEQFEEFIEAKPAALPPQPARKIPPTGIAVIAVVPGAGLAKVYESLGTAVVVPGGQTMNPSTEDILKAIESLENQDIIILPNNKNVILTAQQAEKISDRNVRVVPSKTVPQGISALLAFNYQADLDTNARLMSDALDDVYTGEVTRAVRSVKIDGIEVEEGQIIGILNGDLIAAGSDVTDVVLQIVQQMSHDDLEILTIYYGEGISQAEAQSLADTISERYPDFELETIEGGQPHYPYIISGE